MVELIKFYFHQHCQFWRFFKKIFEFDFNKLSLHMKIMSNISLIFVLAIFKFQIFQMTQSPTYPRFRSRFSRTRSANVVRSTTSEIACRTRPQKPKKWHSPWKSHSLGRDWLTQSTGAIGPST